jgi:tRNA A37 threonylcarbamoyladenosine modification protein TsaB
MHAPREAFWDELRALMSGTGLGVEPRELGSVAVAVGPGGFTGLRVSVAFAKALALARGISVIPVPSALIFAASEAARDAENKGPRLVALAAKGQTAWVALVGSEHRFEREGQVLDGVRFEALAAETAARRGTLLADEHLDGGFVEQARKVGLPRAGLAVDVGAFAMISAEILRVGGAVHPAELLPIYAREPEAVTNWRARATQRGG